MSLTSLDLLLFAFKYPNSVLHLVTSVALSLRNFLIASSAFMYLEAKKHVLHVQSTSACKYLVIKDTLSNPGQKPYIECIAMTQV